MCSFTTSLLVIGKMACFSGCISPFALGTAIMLYKLLSLLKVYHGPRTLSESDHASAQSILHVSQLCSMDGNACIKYCWVCVLK